MIKLENVKKEYTNGVIAISDIDLVIRDGEFVFVVGESGAGKSTLLKMITREETPNDGYVEVLGVNVRKLKARRAHKLRRHIGVVFQDFKLLPRMTVYENVAFTLEVIGEKREHTRRKVYDVLDRVGLKNKAKYFPNQLSGGEQQRVAIARAIINKPYILICDEPTGNLDPVNSKEVMKVLNQINKEGTTVIIATHDKEIVDEMQKRVIQLKHGRIFKDGVGGYQI